MPSDTQHHEIYSRLLAVCEPYQFSDRWSFLTADRDTCRGPSNPSQLLADMIEQYAVGDLVAAGVARALDDGSLAIAQCLIDCHIVIPMWDVETDKISELLTSAGCLSGRMLPVFAALDDRFFHSVSDAEYIQLFLAETIEEVAMLRACGIPATLAIGMRTLAPHDCERLAAIPGAPFDCSDSENLPEGTPVPEFDVSGGSGDADPRV